MMDKKKITEAIKKHGSQVKAAAALGMSRSTMRRILATEKSCSDAGSKKRKTLMDFRREYDRDLIIPSKIREGLKEIGWEYESDFARICGVSLGDLAAYREDFAAHWLTIKRDGRRVWASTKTLCDQLRKMI
jgi:hypothetical protein